MASSFGRQLCAALEAARLSQNGFAKSVGISQGTLSRIIAAQRKPPVDDIPVWAQRLGMDQQQEAEFLHAALLAAGLPRLAHRLHTLKQALQRET